MTTPRTDGWRGPILDHFSAASAAAGRLTVASDPDELLTEPGVVQSLRDRGFELISFEDPVAFRFAYESRFRTHWDRGEATHLVVVIRTQHGDLQHIPHDILEEARACGRVLSFSLADLFPTLAPNVIAELAPAHLDVLAKALEKAAPGNLGTNATRDFVLRHVFEIAPELIKTSADLLRVLLRRHYTARVFPASLDDRFIELLAASEEWRQWPLERIVTRRDAFFSFLGERWPHFLISRGYEAVLGREPTLPEIPGPIALPFDHDDIRVYIDNLFAEGFLQPTSSIDPTSVKGTWYRVGVAGDAVEDARVRLERLLDTVKNTLPPSDADHQLWSQFALRWAEAVGLRWQVDASATDALTERMRQLHDEIEARFAGWMQTHYAAIHSLPHLPRPTTLDKVARYLAHHRNKTGLGKVALVVVDGLALDQWLLVRGTLDGLQCHESQAFAWVPTLTSVSRQAIFAGEPPYFYAGSIGTTYKEPQHWSRFWDDQGLRGPSVAYVCQKKHEIEAVFAERVKDAAEHPQCKVVAVVVGTIDQMMHGNVTGIAGMHAGVREWARQGHFLRLMRQLLSLGFDVFVTADHGNVEGIGIGKPNVGAIADERGERVHVFPHALTRENVHKEYPGTLVWPPIGLPDDYLPLLPPGRGAFIHEGTHVVGHGGISLEEVIVPFVQVMEAR